MRTASPGKPTDEASSTIVTPASERYNKSAIYLHRIGAPTNRDVAVFGWEVSPKNSFALADLPHPATAKGSRWVMMEVLHGDAVDRSYWIAPADKLSGAATPWRRVISPADQVTHAVLAGDAIYAVSQKKASNRELIRLDLAHRDEARTVVPASAAVLQFPVADKDAIYVKALDAGVSRLIRVPLKAGKPSEVRLPFEGTLARNRPRQARPSGPRRRLGPRPGSIRAEERQGFTDRSSEAAQARHVAFRGAPRDGQKP